MIALLMSIKQERHSLVLVSTQQQFFPVLGKPDYSDILNLS